MRIYGGNGYAIFRRFRNAQADALIEQARLLGASRMRLLQQIMLPLSARSVVTAAVLCFTHTVGEFGVVLMVGGNIPGATRTLSISLYDQVQDFNYAGANRTAAVLLAFAMVSLLGIYLWPSLRRIAGRQVDVVR